jgi:hypothetical protein
MDKHKSIRLDDETSSRLLSNHRNRPFNFGLTMNGCRDWHDAKGSRGGLE